jgi:hypothetical protein
MTQKAIRPMTEPEHFASRPWTQADDDNLRRLALTGLSSRAIGIRMNGPKLPLVHVPDSCR